MPLQWKEFQLISLTQLWGRHHTSCGDRTRSIPHAAKSGHFDLVTSIWIQSFKNNFKSIFSNSYVVSWLFPLLNFLVSNPHGPVEHAVTK